MSNFKFFSAMLLILIAIIGASFLLLEISNQLPYSSTLMLVALHFLGSYFLVGIGLALPLVIIATIFSWVHLVLLMTGDIKPHLAGKDFFKALTTLFNNL